MIQVLRYLFIRKSKPAIRASLLEVVSFFKNKYDILCVIYCLAQDQVVKEETVENMKGIMNKAELPWQNMQDIL